MTVSVIIPVYNGCKTLERAVASVLAQSFQPLEIIIVDNASTDDSYELMLSLQQRHPIIKLLKENEKGGNRARNTGLKVATGTWIQFLDADDELLPEKLKDQVEEIERNPGLDMVYSDTELIEVGQEGIHKKVADLIYTDDVLSGLVQFKLGRTTVNLWKKSALNDVGGWDVDRSSFQEYHLILKLFIAGKKFKYIPGNKAISYREGETVSFTNEPDKALKILVNQLDYCRILEQNFDEKPNIPQAVINILKDNKSDLFYTFLFQYPSMDTSQIIEIRKKYNIQKNFKMLIIRYLKHIKQSAKSHAGLKWVLSLISHIFSLLPKLIRFSTV